MKQCDRGLSPFAIGSSFAASESDPDDSYWGDFTFDFSFLTSDDQKSAVGDDDSLSNLSRLADSTPVPPQAEESERYGLAAYGLGIKRDFARPVKDERFDLEIRKGENSDSFLKLPDFLQSDLTCVDSKPRVSPSLAVVPLKASVLGVTRITPVANNVVVSNDNSGDDEAEGWLPCTKDKSAMVRKDISVSNSSPLFAKMSKSFVLSDQDDAEVDSPCWRGTQSHNTAASGTMSLSFRRSSEDLNSLYRLNPLAPQFIPSSAKKNLDKNEKESEENSSSSLKRSLSSTFPPSSGEFSITDPSEAEIPQDSGQKNRTGILIHDADESLGLISQESVSKTMSILDISNQFQMPKKLDPLAPVFVPASAKLSAVVNEKYGVADHMIAAFETNAHSSYALSASEDMFLNNAEVATHSSEVDHSFSNPYSNYVHESGRSYSFNPRLESQVKISENTKLDSFSNKSHVSKKLNPLAPQFSLADTKQKVYGCENNQAANDLPSQVNSSVLFSPLGYSNPKELHPGFAQSSVHAEPSFKEVGTMQMERLPPITLHENSSLKYVAYQPTKVDDSFVSTGKLAVDPKAILPVKDNTDFEHLLPFHIFEAPVSSSSSDVKALSDFGQRHGCSTSSPSSKMDVKKLLTTMHGLSELLTHVHGSESSDSLNKQDLDLINCTVQNLNAYANSIVQEHTGNYKSSVHNSSDFKSSPSIRKLSIKYHRIPKAENVSANLDVKRQEKYSMVSREIGADSNFEYGVTKGNRFGKVVGNYQTEEQISPQVFFYKSLWLKAKADRSLMEYETFLSKARA